MSNARIRYWPASVDESLSHTKWLDLVTIEWMDASQSSNVDYKRNPLANRHVGTRVNSEGRFVRVQEEDYSHIPHVIILKDSMDDHRGIIQSIPLPIVRQLDNYGGHNKQMIARKYAKVLTPYKKGKRTWNRGITQFADGSVKIPEGFYLK